MFENFYGNRQIAGTLAEMISRDRIPQTILLSGPEGVGKATLVRRFAATLLHDRQKIERDDLSRPENCTLIADREKLAAEKRSEDPLLFSSHPDFITFPPDGPLRQISIQQMRLLKARAQFGPLKGRYRVFLIDSIDRANEQASNSLLKILEEPPEYMVLFATAQNAYDLLPTIRSRSLMFHLSPLDDGEMQAFAKSYNLQDIERRTALAGGSPGIAVSLDLAVYDKRRAAMLKLLQAAAGKAPFTDWIQASGALSAKAEKLDAYMKVLYGLLEDVLLLQQQGRGIRNIDIQTELDAIAKAVSFEWLRHAVSKVDDIVEMLRRNIQKGIATDALVLGLGGH